MIFKALSQDDYRATVPDYQIEFRVARLRHERHELHGELTVFCGLAGARVFDDATLSASTMNFSSAQARQMHGKRLAERARTPGKIDWVGLLEELSVRVITAERAGTPARPLQTFDRPGSDAEFVVEGWRLLRDHATIVFGDGGSAKSYLALYAAGRLAGRGVQVLYADWELAGGDHRERLERLFGADMPTVHYMRCDRPLVLEVDRLYREVRRLSIDYLVCDSIAFATGGPPEAAEHATAFFRALRQIGIGSLDLAHINRSENGDQKPFGSAFWHNSARATWFVKLAGASPDGQRLTIGLFNRKANLTRLQPAIGYTFEFTDTSTIVSPTNVADVDDLAGQLPLWQRIAHVIKAGGGAPRTIAEIAEALEAKPDSVKKAVSPNRMRSGKSMFTQVPGVDNVVRIALVDRRRA